MPQKFVMISFFFATLALAGCGGGGGGGGGSNPPGGPSGPGGPAQTEFEAAGLDGVYTAELISATGNGVGAPNTVATVGENRTMTVRANVRLASGTFHEFTATMTRSGAITPTWVGTFVHGTKTWDVYLSTPTATTTHLTVRNGADELVYRLVTPSGVG